VTRHELVMVPLWPNAESAALATNVNPLRWEDLGSYVETWLRERKEGALILGKSVQTMETRIVRIANLPSSFWENRDAKEALEAFDFALHGDLNHPHWGA
jgi:hypothetical protein